VVGKLFADRVIGKDALKTTQVKWWRPTRMISFKVLGENLFLVEFVNSWDKSLILEGRPWVFEGNLFVVEDFNGHVPPKQLGFETVLFGFGCLTFL
jgi:hypothetical protein